MSIYNQIISSISPIEIAKRYLNFKKVGRNYQAICPFHADKKPSLSFDSERGLFYCFGCGKSGNLIHLISEIEGISKFEALKELAKEAGIELKGEGLNEDKETFKLFEVIEFALNEYEKVLFERQGEKARNYLEDRGFKLSTIRRFRIGYAPPEGDFIIKKAREKGINPSFLLEVGLITGSQGVIRDFFKDRIIFPIFNISSKCVAFGGRAFEGEPKYLNSPDSKIFKKGKNLYGIDIAKNKAKRDNTIIIVEGYTDVMKMVECGFENTVAPLGTAFSIEQALLIKKFADIIIVLYDGDDAGKRGMKRILPFLLQVGLKVKVAELPQNEDPESFLRKKSKEDMDKLINGAKNFLDALLPETLPSDAYVQSILLSDMINFISFMPNDIEKELFVKKLSERFLISPEYIKRRIESISLKEEKKVERDTLSSEFTLFGIIAFFNKFNKEEMERRGIDHRVFRSEILKEVTLKILEGSAFEDVLFELKESERKKLLESIFKSREKYISFGKEGEENLLYEYAFEKLKNRMERILKREKIFKEWKDYRSGIGSNPSK
ncbi:MAG: DNA primase [Candidatus Hydrothermales bacterium]